MSIELVDQIDQKSNKRYQKIGFNDLLLNEEEGDGVMYDIKPTGSSEDYVGMELDMDTLDRGKKKRKRNFILILSCLCTLILFIYVIRLHGSNTTTAASTANTSPGGSSGKDTPSVNSPSNSDNDSDNDDTTVEYNPSPQAPILWPTNAPLPEFRICPPPVKIPNGVALYRMGDLVIVPEAAAANGDKEEEMINKWEYTFSSMDISEEASIIAVGLSDFARDTDLELGLVRVFGWACDTNEWKQLGQDLLGTNQYEEFGYAVSSSRDGRVVAVSATQGNYEGGTGFVQVYFLNDNHWDLLGNRIQNMTSMDEFYNYGTAIDLSDAGETLAVIGLLSESSYITHVHTYDSNTKSWARKGNDIVLSVPDSLDFEPSVKLSNDGNEMALGDPEVGVLLYSFHFETGNWIQKKKKAPEWPADDYYVDNFDMDDSGSLVAFSAFVDDGPNRIKIMDYDDDGQNATEVYVRSYKDLSVSIAVDVSKDGQVAAVVASREDEDDNVFWDGDYVGAMTIVSKGQHDGKWFVVGEGTKSENLGVPGNFVSLSGDGTIAAVGSDTVIALYGIALNHEPGNFTPTQGYAVTNTTSALNSTVGMASNFTICAPFPNATANSHAGDLDQLPKQLEEHTLSVAMSADASIVAVGIDSYILHTRGLARVFAWDCYAHTYTQLGQDLIGDEALDGFGQSVDLSSDGKTLVVGANQPPPGKSGYVDVFTFDDIHQQWTPVGKRLTNMTELVEDIGREVRISSDGSTIAIHGSVVDSNLNGYLSSFIRVVENVDGKWISKGNDLIGSIEYVGNGVNTRIALSADGSTLGVTGSYSNFLAKVYTFNTTKQNWTETIIPPIKSSDNSVNDEWDEEFDEYFTTIFDGTDIGLSDDGRFISVGGRRWVDSFPIIRVLELHKMGNWTMTHNALDMGSFDVLTVTSAAISGDAKMVAVGAGANTFALDNQGGLFVSAMNEKDLSWGTLGQVLGRAKNDYLGARVAMSNDGTLAAASSRKGYVSFFRTSRV